MVFKRCQEIDRRCIALESVRLDEPKERVEEPKGLHFSVAGEVNESVACGVPDVRLRIGAVLS